MLPVTYVLVKPGETVGLLTQNAIVLFFINDNKGATWVDLAVASGLMPTTSSVSYLHNQTPKESFESFSIRLFVSMVTDRIIRNCSGHLR